MMSRILPHEQGQDPSHAVRRLQSALLSCEPTSTGNTKACVLDSNASSSHKKNIDIHACACLVQYTQASLCCGTLPHSSTATAYVYKGVPSMKGSLHPSVIQGFPSKCSVLLKSPENWAPAYLQSVLYTMAQVNLYDPRWLHMLIPTYSRSSAVQAHSSIHHTDGEREKHWKASQMFTDTKC